MTFDGPPLVTALDTAFNFTLGDMKDPWTHQISKYLGTSPSRFQMNKINYTKFRLNPAIDKAYVNQGCGQLQYTLSQLSWNQTWIGNDIVSTPLGSAATGDGGVIIFNLMAEKRFQIGDHNVTVKIKSDQMPIATTRYVEFRVKILDCYLQRVEVGHQDFQSLVLELDKEASFPFKNYTQTPSCGFQIDYTVTLIRTFFGANQLPEFDPGSEGKGLTTDPELISLDVKDNILHVKP